MLRKSWPTIAEEYAAALRRRDQWEADTLIGSVCLYALETQGRMLTNEVSSVVYQELGCYVPWSHILRALRSLTASGYIEAQRKGGGGVLYRFVSY